MRESTMPPVLGRSPVDLLLLAEAALPGRTARRGQRGNTAATLPALYASKQHHTHGTMEPAPSLPRSAATTQLPRSAN